MKLFGRWGSRFRRRGSKLLLQGQWEQAAAEFRKSIARTPDCLESLQGLGIALLKQELWQEGAEVLETATAICSDLPASLHAQLGMARIQQSRWPEALIALTRATEIEPGNADYHALCGTALLNLHRWQEAVVAFGEAIESNPHDAAHYHGQAQGLLNLQRWQEAVVAYGQAIELNPDEGAYYHGQAQGLLKLQRWQEAVAVYETAIKRIPHDDSFYQGLAQGLLKLQRWQEAVDAYDTAIASDPNDFSSYEGQALALFELGRYEETVAAAGRCIELQSDVASTYVRLGAALMKLRRDADAVAALQHAVKIDPDLTDVHQMLAQTFARMGESKQAIEAYRRVIALDPNAKSRIAVPLAELGFVDPQDLAELRAKVQSDPACYQSLVQLASLLAIKQDWNETIEIAQRALIQQPDGRECHGLLGQAYLAQGKYETAIECFRRAIQKFSEYNFVRDDDELTWIRNCYRGLAAALDKLGRVEETLEVYQRQLNVTFDPETCLAIGREFQQHRKDDLATRSFVRAIVMNHYHLDAYKVLGDHLEKTGRHDEALIVYKQVNLIGRADDDLRDRLTRSLQQASEID